MDIFDGYTFSEKREAALRERVAQLAKTGVQLKIAAVLFSEDSGSRLYTRLKSEAAQRVGIAYEVFEFSLATPVAVIVDQITALNQDQTVTGIIIQKPGRKTWVAACGVGESDAGQRIEEKEKFNLWWKSLTQTIDPTKDVDGLHPSTLAAIEQGTWRELGRVLPATAQAVLDIVRHKNRVGSGEAQIAGSAQSLSQNPYGISDSTKIIIIGSSDIVGKPLYYELKNYNLNVEMIGSAGLQQRVASGVALRDTDIVISATGREHLITGEMIKEGSWVIDVGEPRPDVDAVSVAGKAAFLTPVPGGVGPMTVICLLENCLKLWYNTNS